MDNFSSMFIKNQIFVQKLFNCKKIVLSLHIPTNKCNKNMNIKGRINLRGRMLEMAPGEQLEVSDFSYVTIRSYCSDLGWAYDRKYSSRRNREAKSVTITRVS